MGNSGSTKPKTFTRRRREATAYHEAGHAVAALHEDRPFKYVTIKPSEDSIGHVHYEASVVRTSARMADRNFMDYGRLLVSLAGCKAERRRMGRHNHAGAYEDYRRAVEVVCLTGETGGMMEDRPFVRSVVRAAMQEAEDLVNMWWPEVDAVAKALVARETLSRSDVLDVINAERVRERTIANLDRWAKRTTLAYERRQRKFMREFIRRQNERARQLTRKARR